MEIFVIVLLASLIEQLFRRMSPARMEPPLIGFRYDEQVGTPVLRPWANARAHRARGPGVWCRVCGTRRPEREADAGCLECDLQSAFESVAPAFWRRIDELVQNGRTLRAIVAVRSALPRRFTRNLLIARDLVAERAARFDRTRTVVELVALAPPAAARCPVCATPVGEGTLQCSACETYHHAECWEYTGSCGIYACGSAAHQ